MTQISRDSKRKHRNKALPVLSVAGLSVALASAASAVPAGPATDMAGLTPGEGHQITFGEEEISDVTLATFYVFDKENVVGSSEPAVELVGHGHGCGGHGHGCGGCGGHGHHGCGGCGGHGHRRVEAAEVTTTMAVEAAEAAATTGEAASESGSAAAAAVAAAVVVIGVGRTAYGSGVGTRPVRPAELRPVWCFAAVLE